MRATRTGVSAHVDATGRVRSETDFVDPSRQPRRAGAALASAALMEGGHTVYAAVGDLFGYLCAAAALFMLLAAAGLPRRCAGRLKRFAAKNFSRMSKLRQT